MSEDFYRLAKEIHEENLVNKWHKLNSPQSKAGWEMTLFEIYCRINKIEVSFENFLKYLETLKKEERPIAVLRKMIAENYFNKKFEYNLDLRKWELVS